MLKARTEEQGSYIMLTQIGRPMLKVICATLKVPTEKTLPSIGDSDLRRSRISSSHGEASQSSWISWSGTQDQEKHPATPGPSHIMDKLQRLHKLGKKAWQQWHRS